MTRCIVFNIAATALLFVGTAPAEDLADRTAILPKSQGTKLLNQCSRTAPLHVSEFWIPSAASVRAAEKALPEALRATAHKIDLRNCYRQYLGIVSGGKKLIYVNAFSGTVFVHEPLRKSWKSEAMMVCDGGDVFWGAVFDPATNAFTDFQFNGAI